MADPNYTYELPSSVYADDSELYQFNKGEGEICAFFGREITGDAQVEQGQHQTNHGSAALVGNVHHAQHGSGHVHGQPVTPSGTQVEQHIPDDIRNRNFAPTHGAAPNGGYTSGFVNPQDLQLPVPRHVQQHVPRQVQQHVPRQVQQHVPRQVQQPHPGDFMQMSQVDEQRFPQHLQEIARQHIQQTHVYGGIARGDPRHALPTPAQTFGRYVPEHEPQLTRPMSLGSSTATSNSAAQLGQPLHSQNVADESGGSIDHQESEGIVEDYESEGSAGDHESQPQSGALKFRSFADAESAMDTRKLTPKQGWKPLQNDPTFPLTQADQLRYVTQLLSSMQDLSEYQDSDKVPHFHKRWGSKATIPYKNDEMEHACWKLFDIAQRLHALGPLSLSVFDHEALNLVSRTARWTFAERIDKVCLLLRVSKHRCHGLMKNDGYAMLVGNPSDGVKRITKHRRDEPSEVVAEEDPQDLMEE